MALFNKIFPPKADPPSAEKSKSAADSGKTKREKTEHRKEIGKKEGPTIYTPGILLRPHVTEKSSIANSLNQYVFRVKNTANKPQVKAAVEGKYRVRVCLVRIINVKSRKVRLGRIEGEVPGYKKAIVTLQPGDKIEIGV